MPKQPPQTDIEKMIAAMHEGRQLVIELHTAVRDAKQAMKELRSLRSELLSREELRDRLDTISEQQIERYSSAIDLAIKQATDAVNNRFDTIMMICMGEDPLSVRQGKRTTIELIKDYVNAKKLPIRITEEVYVLISPEIKKTGDESPAMQVSGGLERLPIVVDHRVPPGTLFLCIPQIADQPAQVIEVNILTGEGVERSRQCLREYDILRDSLIPDAFRKGEGVEPA